MIRKISTFVIIFPVIHANLDIVKQYINNHKQIKNKYKNKDNYSYNRNCKNKIQHFQYYRLLHLIEYLA